MSPHPFIDTTATQVSRLEACAEALRAAAAQVERSVDDLHAFDRPDVWQGGRATVFREGLHEHRVVLTDPANGVAARLREGARVVDLRAAGLRADLEHADRDRFIAAAGRDPSPNIVWPGDVTAAPTPQAPASASPP